MASTGQQVKSGFIVWLLFGWIMLVSVLVVRLIAVVAIWFVKVAIFVYAYIQAIRVARREKNNGSLG